MTPSAPKVRQVLALLLLRHSQVVHTWELIDELWGDAPPVSAPSTLQTYIYKLRKTLSDVLPGAYQDPLVTKPQGYLLEIPPEDLDLYHFQRLLEAGTAELAEDKPETAAETLSKALDLWRGPPLAGVSTGQLLSAYTTSLEESRFHALELRIETDLRLGRHGGVIGELKRLNSIHPLHEGFHTKLMLALYRSGRRSEALEVYQRLRSSLVEELGIEPSAETQRLHQSMLSSDPTLDLASSREVTVRAPTNASPAFPRPAQLPPRHGDFVGRAEDLAAVVARLSSADSTSATGPIISITGMAGVGKTALALNAAHQVRRRFRDGQLYVDLRGTGERPIDPACTLDDFLRAVGVPADQVPDGLDERSKMFRSWSADRQLLVILDDAGTTGQVMPLLPAGEECAVIVTGRTGLHGIPGADHVKLDVLSVAEGVELLGGIIEPHLVAAEPEEAEEIVRFCGNLPLAIRIAGARLAATAGWPLSKLAARLRRPRGRLDELRFGDLNVRALLDSSYRRLSEQDRGVLRLLSLLDDAGFSTRGAVELLGCDAESVEAPIERLVENHFLRVLPCPFGHVGIRFAFHELARLYARERLEEQLADIRHRVSDVHGTAAGLNGHSWDERKHSLRRLHAPAAMEPTRLSLENAEHPEHGLHGHDMRTR